MMTPTRRWLLLITPGLSTPQYGQVLACVETSFLHSLHLVNAMGFTSSTIAAGVS
jgi:hypothetical protein